MEKEILTEEEKKDINWFFTANMEEILTKSVENNWVESTLNMWINFKKAQYLEMIAYKKV